MLHSDLFGIHATLTTPFDFDGQLDLRGLRHNLDICSGAGLTKFVALGVNGEGVCLTSGEQEVVLATVREKIGPDAKLLAGITEQSTFRAIRSIARAADAGAEGALVLSPTFYEKRPAQQTLLRFFRAVADASAIPVVIDHEPSVAAALFEPASVEALAVHPRIVGFLDGTGNQSTLTQLVRRVPPEFAILTARAGVMLAGLEAGAVGAILPEACLAPKQCLELYDLQRAGMRVKATALQARLAPLSQAIATRWGVPGLKASLGLIGSAGGPPRAPLESIDRADRQRLVGILRATGFFPVLTRTG